VPRPAGQENPEASAGATYGRNARDAARLQSVSMKCSSYLAGLAVLIMFGAAPAFGAVSASVSGVVRDSAGVPQIGAEVQLLRPDLTIVASVYTDSAGRFLIKALTPGRYSLKAMGPSFLPSLRENVRIHSVTVVNLTLNTLYEVLQWLPAQPRVRNSQSDDWKWTLYSAANRPLLRMLEDGPLIVVSEGPGAQPKLKARLMATGQAGTFGESGERFSTTVEDTPAGSKELLARVDFAPGTNGNMESMLGFRQDLGFAGSVQSVAAVSVDPQVTGSGGQGLDEAVIESSETMHFGEAVEADVGSTAVLGRLAGPASSTTTAMLPFANIAWHSGPTTIHYRMASMIRPQAPDQSDARVWQPAMAERNGALTIEHGVHQEFGWERQTDASGMAVLVYADNLRNPVMEALDQFAAGDSPATASVLFDQASNLIRAAGPSFSSQGVQASVEHRIAGENRLRVSYSSGSALVMPAMPHPASLAEVLSSAHPHRAETYAISLSGTIEGTKTRWHASYTWQPEDTITAVAPFSQDASEPFLNVHLSQPIHVSRDGAGGIEALLDIKNLLAEGYRPYILSDGSLLLFAQDQRGVRAGLAFTF
jgi:hypothetical protein